MRIEQEIGGKWRFLDGLERHFFAATSGTMSLLPLSQPDVTPRDRAAAQSRRPAKFAGERQFSIEWAPIHAGERRSPVGPWVSTTPMNSHARNRPEARHTERTQGTWRQATRTRTAIRARSSPIRRQVDRFRGRSSWPYQGHHRRRSRSINCPVESPEGETSGRRRDERDLYAPGRAPVSKGSGRRRALATTPFHFQKDQEMGRVETIVTVLWRQMAVNGKILAGHRASCHWALQFKTNSLGTW